MFALFCFIIIYFLKNKINSAWLIIIIAITIICAHSMYATGRKRSDSPPPSKRVLTESAATPASATIDITGSAAVLASASALDLAPAPAPVHNLVSIPAPTFAPVAVRGGFSLIFLNAAAAGLMLSFQTRQT